MASAAYSVGVKLKRYTRYPTYRTTVPWLVVLVAAVLDLWLTYHGLRRGLPELNPIAVAALNRFGYGALILVKGSALAVAVGGWTITPLPYRRIVPIVLVFPWIVAVLLNAAALTGTM